MPRFYRAVFRVAPWFCGLIALFFASILFLSAPPGIAEWVLAGLGVGGFGWLAKASIQTLRHLPLADVSVDEEGIWPTLHARATSRIPWSRVAHVRARQTLQRLELLDASGALLIRLEYQLNGFERLREIVMERAALVPTPMMTDRAEYAAPWWHHLLYVSLAVAFTLVGWYASRVSAFNSVLVALFVGFLIWEYRATPYRLRVGHDALELRSLGRTRVLRREDIAAVEMGDEFSNHARRSHVRLRLNGPAKPLSLKVFSVPALDLLWVLRAWHSGGSEHVRDPHPGNDVLS